MFGRDAFNNKACLNTYLECRQALLWTPFTSWTGLVSQAEDQTIKLDAAAEAVVAAAAAAVAAVAVAGPPCMTESNERAVIKPCSGLKR